MHQCERSVRLPFSGYAVIPVLAGLLACSDGITEMQPPPPPPPLDEIELTVEYAFSTSAMPTYGTAPKGDSRFFVSTLDGIVWIVEDDEVLPEPFLDIRDLVSIGEGERGFLGMAFHPDFQFEPYFYVNYSDLDGHNQVERYRVDPENPNRIDRDSRFPIILIEQPDPYHNGGELVFGPDRMLYVALGDGSQGQDAAGHGQNPHTLLGSMLRIDVLGGEPYAIPTDNPFADGQDGRPEVWNYGLRHAWRFAFDQERDLLYLPDVGENTWEEVNVVPAREGGHNFGWAVMEGPDCFAEPECDTTGTTLPVLYYGMDEGCAVIGGFVYEGAAIPSLRGAYLFGDHCTPWLRAIRYAGGELVDDASWDLPDFPGFDGRRAFLNSFGRDGQGEIYLLTTFGAVLRVVER